MKGKWGSEGTAGGLVKGVVLPAGGGDGGGLAGWLAGKGRLCGERGRKGKGQLDKVKERKKSGSTRRGERSEAEVVESVEGKVCSCCAGECIHTEAEERETRVR